MTKGEQKKREGKVKVNWLYPGAWAELGVVGREVLSSSRTTLYSSVLVEKKEYY